jgi:hypothetical protein
MPLKKRGKWWHAGSAADLDEFLLKKVLGPLQRRKEHRVAHAECAACGKRAFDLFTDHSSHVLRVCTACGGEHRVCDPGEDFDEESAGEIVCTCMYSECEIAVGFALTPVATNDAKTGERAEPSVTYLYVAGRCTHCGLCGVYGEWRVRRAFPFREWAGSV